MIATSDYINDQYANFRSREATHIIGVSMKLTYLANTKPSSKTTNSPSDDEFSETTYTYDLELNKTGEIIGGEWHNIFHPDFLWVISEKYVPRTIGDFIHGGIINDYNGTMPLKNNIIALALESTKTHELLYIILEAMLKLSNKAIPSY